MRNRTRKLMFDRKTLAVVLIYEAIVVFFSYFLLSSASL